MTMHLLDCPDCRTEFRIRELQNPVPLHCPRCGEAMDPRQARLRPPKEKKKTPRPVAAERGDRQPAATHTGRPRATESKKTKQRFQPGPVTAVAVVLLAGTAVSAALYIGFRIAIRPSGTPIAQSFTRPLWTSTGAMDGETGRAADRRIQNSLDAVQRAMDAVNSRPPQPGFTPPATLPQPGFTPSQPPAAPAFNSPITSEPPNIPSDPQPPESAFPNPRGRFGSEQLDKLRERMQADMDRMREQTSRLPTFGRPPRFGERPTPGFPSGPPNLPGPGTPPAFGSPPAAGTPAAGIPQVPGTDEQPEVKIRNLLQAIEAQNGSVAVTGPLGLLRLGAVVPAVRNEVLRVIQPLRKSQNQLIAAGANEVFSFWATQEQTEELRELATSKDLSQVAARRLALQTLIGFGTPTLDPAVVSSLDDLIYSNEIQQALIKLGGNAEGPILQAWPMVTTAAGKRVLIEVLGQVGGEPSIQLLQQLAESPDREVRIPATLAVKKIQSRR